MKILVDYYRRSGHPIIIYYNFTDVDCSVFNKSTVTGKWEKHEKFGRGKDFFKESGDKYVNISNPALKFEQDDYIQLIKLIFTK